MTRLAVALGEYDIGWHDPATSIQRAAELTRRAAAGGARLVVLPEMSTTGFTNAAADYAEPADGPSAKKIAAVARENGVWIIAGIATRANEGGREAFYNSSILFSPDGAAVAEYRKQRLFAYAEEHGTYTAGSAAVIADVEGARVAMLICFDLRFPELFREVAPSADLITVIASWPKQRQSHWDVLLRARSIETQAYVIGVNRVGRGGNVDYTGGSAAYDPWGEPLPSSGDPRIVIIDSDLVASTRKKFPMVIDARSR